MNENFNPDMLSLARDVRGLTQRDLAERAKLTQGTISKYEGNLQTPSHEDIENLANALDFPTSFFYRGGKRQGTLDGHIFHRKKSKATVSDTKRFDGHLELLRLQTEDLLADFDFNPTFYVPQLDIEDYYGDAELVAEAVRSLWSMPKGPVSNLIGRLEAAGCFVYLLDLGTEDIDENVQWVTSSPPVILGNNRFSGDRLRFSLAHALGHLVMHQNLVPHKDRETEANLFASAFLMPAEDIREYISPVTLQHLFELKPFWKVSVAAMIMRAHQIGEITDTRKKSLFQMLSRSGWRKSEPVPIEREKPHLVHDLFHAYRADLSYKDIDLARKVHMYSPEFRRINYPDEPILKVV